MVISNRTERSRVEASAGVAAYGRATDEVNEHMADRPVRAPARVL